jgi:hypothetical protein
MTVLAWSSINRMNQILSGLKGQSRRNSFSDLIFNRNLVSRLNSQYAVLSSLRKMQIAT